MELLKFKTNINCGGCVKAVKGFIEEVPGIKSWSVDTANPDKVLQVEAEAEVADQVIAVVKEAGFEIEALVAC